VQTFVRLADVVRAPLDGSAGSVGETGELQAKQDEHDWAWALL